MVSCMCHCGFSTDRFQVRIKNCRMIRPNSHDMTVVFHGIHATLKPIRHEGDGPAIFYSALYRHPESGCYDRVTISPSPSFVNSGGRSNNFTHIFCHTKYLPLSGNQIH